MGPFWRVAALACASVLFLAVTACSSTDGHEGSVPSELTPASSAEGGAAFTEEEDEYIDMATEDTRRVVDLVRVLKMLVVAMPWDSGESMQIGAAARELGSMRDKYRSIEVPSPRFATFAIEWNAALASFAKGSEKFDYANEHGDARALREAAALMREGENHAARASDEMIKLLG
jgi:hypothetical protein